jgi:hypothetical protein
MKESLSCSENNSPKKRLFKAERLTKNRFCFEPIQKINQVDDKRETFCESAQMPNKITQNEPANDVSLIYCDVFVWLCLLHICSGLSN